MEVGENGNFNLFSPQFLAIVFSKREDLFVSLPKFVLDRSGHTHE